ncbi:MAG: DAK2 domain-containing protein [Pseudonocardiaceae bacterium]
MLQSLDGAAVRRWAATCCDALAAHRDEIDALNVFPVPDQDTGSNLLATMRAGVDAVLRDHGDDRDVPLGRTVAVLARGALLGARGNSGVILSQVLRGLAEPLLGEGAESDSLTWDGAALREGLCRADELALAAVSDPVEGTVLTVLHAAAQAAAAVRSDELGKVASAATVAAVGALADTPRLLAALATAGVVDAGGRGLILLLEALLAVVTGQPGGLPAATTEVYTRPVHAPYGARESGSTDGDVTGHEYEVMYLLEGADDAGVCTLRADLTQLGDCVAVVGTGQAGDRRVAALWNVHVHCSDVGAAIEAGLRAGRPHCITVLRFADQIAAQDRWCTGHAVLVVVTGSAVAELCRREGVTTAPASSSVADLVTTLAATRARHVTVLTEPGLASAAEVAAAAVQSAGQEVVVLLAPSPVQALAAVAVHDGSRRPAEDRRAMSDAVTATRCGELTVASDSLAAAGELVARMLSVGGELVTVLLGQDAPDGFANALGEQLRAAHPEVETVVYAGDVPERVLLVGVE